MAGFLERAKKLTAYWQTLTSHRMMRDSTKIKQGRLQLQALYILGCGETQAVRS